MNESKNERIGSGLLRWFEKNRRAFPWREHFNHPDPFLVLFAEVMLQRTRAEQAARVYGEFISRYPNFDTLKQAPRNEVKKLLHPLGLNWRVERIIELIDFLEKELDGKVPEDYDKLKELPGVGSYAASAVMCYAFHKPIMAIDVNAVRIISRIFGLRYTKHTKGGKKIREIANSLAPACRARDLNLCFLDFGALVCTAANPRCSDCPVNSYCAYYAGSR